jgi:hypothetical protein
VTKGPPPNWSRRDCRFDHLVVAAISRGYGTELVYNGIDDYERADEIRRGIYRCAKHRGLTAEAGPAREADPGEMGIHKKRDGTWEVRYRMWDKRTGRKRHLERHGPDRASWPYDPRRGATDEERQSWANRDETGRPVVH